MRALLVLAVFVGSAVAFSGCLEAGDDAKAKQAGGVRLSGASGLVKYQGPSLAIMDTPLSTFTKIICDPSDCLRRLTTMETGPANEVMLAQDYTNPAFLLAGSKDYHADNPACVVVSVYVSIDGGRTWSDGYPRPREGVMGGPSTDRCESDPVTAFDGLGNAFVITLDTGEGLFTYRTADQGKTWTEVAMAFEGGNDKNWGATDYRINRVYSITRATCNGGEAITRTDDSGESWQGPFCFNGMDFAQVDVGPDGTVYAVGSGQGGLAFAKSVDGGEIWTTPAPIVQTGGFTTTPVTGGHAYRTPALPDMAVSLATGAIYVTWHQTNDGQQDVMFTATFDEGETWIPPIVVPDDSTGADQFIPAVASSPNGDAHVIFFDARNDPSGRGHLLDVYYAHLPVDPATGRFAPDAKFEKNLRLTPESFLPYLSRHQQQPFFLGDYVGLTASNSEAVGVFPVTLNDRAEIHAAVVGGEPVT